MLQSEIPEIQTDETSGEALFPGEPICGPHSALVDPTLPLLAQSWQRDRIVLGDHGRFDPRSKCSAGQLAIDLVHDDKPALTRIGAARVTLAYSPQTLGAAQSALIASAAAKGWPVAGDNESLALLTLAERIAASEIPVLLEGPTGTGKEVIARFVHRMSARKDAAFLAVNCAAMPEAMLEGMLFGHRKGAFTGAAEAREGLFRAADGGTLLLDEIGELPIALQAKLLRVLQEGEVLPLGATKPVSVNVRIVASTNRTLASEVQAGRFREDLLYRLNVFPMALPALRTRAGDIAPLAFAMLLRHACEPGMPCWISQSALDMLKAHVWPGNVRELENVIRRAILLAGKEPCIGSEHIVFDQKVRPVDAAMQEAGEASPTPSTPSRSGAKSLSDVAFQSEAKAILSALESHNGHRARTAQSLGISERTLRYRLASMRETGLIAKGGKA
ncbi:sigma 54-interacting transcriptional regulator [uncultured Erythrobacter sp.]|uniref:sigma-54 interaction domain-containing protein n=1 Tax=uncultured Erythrobacter sp. TaxID=263913 RepID=UPI00262A26AA|nr:sigma 54-interacting transcriptional regulator [uncultured Erythrobacter sp.]